MATAVTVAEKETAATSCVHRWAYRLARSGEASTVVAKAVMGSCEEPTRLWAVAADEQAGTDLSTFRSPLSGAATDSIRYRFERMEAMTLHHVLQARAGHCRVP